MKSNKLRASEAETLKYIMTLLKELIQMAEAGRMPLISHFMSMAYIESGDVLRGSRPVRPSSKASSTLTHKKAA